jgi:glycolate oxidase
VLPGLVVLVSNQAEVAVVVAACAAHGVPFVVRGSGTGLSGGALPLSDGVVIVTSKLRAIEEIDVANERAILEPGVTNLSISDAAGPAGYFFAPDPSSQQVCSIGGNVAENSGGAHCMKYGFTTNHVTGLEIVTADGGAHRFGGWKAVEAPGYDLVGAFVGSEGTLGIATRVAVRLTRRPEIVRTLLAAYASTDKAGVAVSAIVAAGIEPAAVEMMDALAIEAAEAAVHCGYPTGAGAVLIVELDGPASEVGPASEAVESLLVAHGASEVQIAPDDATRARLWKGRKAAFAAVGRISPDYIVQDGVVPRSALPAVLADIATLAAESGIRVANVFHAGDGNLHPLVLFDDAVPGESERAHALSKAILGLCLARGGSLTGEHGIGVDKLSGMGEMFSADDLDTMQRLRCAFDPDGLANPGKVFPTPRLCGEAPLPAHDHPRPPRADIGEVF